MRDDHQMDRFDSEGLSRFSARQAVYAVLVTAAVLLLFEGPSIRNAGERMDPGIARTLVRAVGEPAGYLGDKLPFAGVGNDLTGWLSPDDDLGGEGGFEGKAVAQGPGGVAPVGPEAFDPRALGQKPKPIPLRRLLVTGDSLSQPLDSELARRLEGAGVEVDRDPHVGSGISKSVIVDWGKLAVSQAKKGPPDAVVVFLGANEGFPIPGAGGRQVECCGPDWAALYATRVRRMMDTYRRGGAARVYWLTLPAPRDGDLAPITRTVNQAIAAAAAPYRAQVRVLDTVPVFTPGGKYRSSMEVGGKETIVRESDGLHLNAAGARVEADKVEEALRGDFTR
ncbi:MAG: DUF459 domain-containing protein [Thermoleophilaceae bacterium]|nr:DUF459 domain-containing protein [Thermoleophilaceae bacterium]